VRIVSLLPNATEIICSLGLLDELIGVTHECDYPSSVLDLPKVTKTIIPHDASSPEIDSLEIISHAMHPHIHPRPLYAPAAECINQNMVV
jgi:ABC-type Fe3+-hydroxamate transport system substrate-binding protein